MDGFVGVVWFGLVFFFDIVVLKKGVDKVVVVVGIAGVDSL